VVGAGNTRMGWTQVSGQQHWLARCGRQMAAPEVTVAWVIG